jgi:hypothetical protein
MRVHNVAFVHRKQHAIAGSAWEPLLCLGRRLTGGGGEWVGERKGPITP